MQNYLKSGVLFICHPMRSGWLWSSVNRVAWASQPKALTASTRNRSLVISQESVDVWGMIKEDMFDLCYHQKFWWYWTIHMPITQRNALVFRGFLYPHITTCYHVTKVPYFKWSSDYNWAMSMSILVKKLKCGWKLDKQASKRDLD